MDETRIAIYLSIEILKKIEKEMKKRNVRTRMQMIRTIIAEYFDKTR